MRAVIGLVLGLALAAAHPASAEDMDPFEPANRAVFSFNHGLAEWVVRPTGHFFTEVLPEPMQKGLANAFANLVDVQFLATNLLALDLTGAGVSAVRVALNTTVGVAGLIDVAAMVGLHRRPLEIGQALCAVGAPAGSFLVLPVVGATNAVSAGVVAGAVVLDAYGVGSLLTRTVGLVRVLIDLGFFAGAVRNAGEVTDGGSFDPYLIYRASYLNYIESACGMREPAWPTLASSTTPPTNR